MASTQVTQFIKADRETVYRALLDPQAITEWKVPDGMTGLIHEFDAREGGRFRVSLTYEAQAGTGKTTAQTDTYHGYFKKLVAQEQVVEVTEFETSDPSLSGEMTITMTIRSVSGGTELVALHEDLPPGLQPSDNELGWRLSLEKLARLCER